MQVACVLLGAAAVISISRRVLPKPKTPVYLIDTYCYKGPDQLRLSNAGLFMSQTSLQVWLQHGLDLD